MIKSFTEFKKLFDMMYKHKIETDKLFKSYPSAYKDLLINEPYLEQHLFLIDNLSDTIFDKYLEDVNWFLYDWKPGFYVETNGIKFVINTVDDFLQYMEQVWWSE